MALLKGPPGNTAGGGPFFRPTSPGTFYSTPNPQRMLPYSNLSSPISPPFSLTLPSSETNFCIPILSRFLFPSNACPPPEEIRAGLLERKNNTLSEWVHLSQGRIVSSLPAFSAGRPVGGGKIGAAPFGIRRNRGVARCVRAQFGGVLPGGGNIAGRRGRSGM